MITHSYLTGAQGKPLTHQGPVTEFHLVTCKASSAPHPPKCPLSLGSNARLGRGLRAWGRGAPSALLSSSRAGCFYLAGVGGLWPMLDASLLAQNFIYPPRETSRAKYWEQAAAKYWQPGIIYTILKPGEPSSILFREAQGGTTVRLWVPGGRHLEDFNHSKSFFSPCCASGLRRFIRWFSIFLGHLKSFIIHEKR